MTEDDRPKPEELLALAHKEESEKKRGHLKIFLGMAAGVGKTYAMLEAGQKLKRMGVDVAAGVINTHGREETKKLVEGLEVIPLKKIMYKDVAFEEMDIDAILARKPKVVLVDELAHSNVPGARHPKRWQDVNEILDHGINVYTTLNVQHIESLKDIVEKIVSIPIRETVPDVVVAQATSIELIDLTPEELRERLKEGKVYLGDQSIIAAENFFQTDRLTALREIVLRYAAEKVDHELHDMHVMSHFGEGWRPRERLLVAVSHSPHSQKLIRITRRLAFNLDVPWIAVHIDDGKILDKEEKETLAKNLGLARDLGAEVITTTASDIAQGIQRIARQKSVTQIVLGRPPKRWFFDLFQGYTLLDKLARECSDIDLHVIRQTTFYKPYGKFWKWFKLTDKLSSYFLVFCLVLALSFANTLLLAYMSYKVAGFIFLLGILVMSLFFRKGPIIFASILYATIWYTFFIPHAESVSIADEDIILLACYVLTAIFTGILTDRAKIHKEHLIKRERSIENLYEIVKEIAVAETPSQVITSVKDQLGGALDGTCEIVVKKSDGGLNIDPSIPLFQDEKEKAAAEWVFQNGKDAGWSTATLPYATHLYIPLRGRSEIVGVLAFSPHGHKELSIEENNFLYTVAQQLANYFERHFSEEKSQKLQQHHQVEKIYESILNLLANLFEGPLLTIQDGVKELQQVESPKQNDVLEHSVELIQTSSESLHRILENIMAMVNLSAGLTPINRKKQRLEDLIQLCYETLQKTINTHQWACRIEEGIPEITFDYELVELLVYNLAFHVIEYAFPDTTIDIHTHVVGDFVIVAISGDGKSIPLELVDIAFEKFYRLPTASTSGLGLGLAIANSIAQIHGGTLTIKNRPAGGMVFSLHLPIE
jgi:two-component system sensor histidine kinase KdpD